MCCPELLLSYVARSCTLRLACGSWPMSWKRSSPRGGTFNQPSGRRSVPRRM
jgi:hypothetical protein